MTRTSAKQAAPEPEREAAVVPAKPRPQGRGKKPKQASPTENGATTDKLQQYHERLQTILDILDGTFGKWADSKPDLWDRRAYLLLVGLVYERLATDVELSTDELVRLAKALADNRRVDARSEKEIVEAGAGGASENADAHGCLPNRLADAVRQVYGASVTGPGRADYDQPRA